jgi:murein DD-endopeptidase MepM/ murein hydrolase activator NlpD
MILLGAPLDIAPGSYKIVGDLETLDSRLTFVREVNIRHRTFPEQRLRVAREMVAPDPSLMPRIEDERRLVRAALEQFSKKRHWAQPFVRPVDGSVSSAFGLRRFFNDEPRAPHRGVDLRGDKGTAVRAFSAGKVILTGNHFFAGKSVYLDHGLGLITQYIHLSEINVTDGQMVSAGQVIGKLGSTGRVTGPHLHFGVSVLGTWVDPMPLLE